jgi:cephalosporin-C deacetylase
VPRFDLPLAELQTYRSDAREPADFGAFWADQLARCREAAWPIRSEPYRRDVYHDLLVDDVTFAGAGGHPVRGWFVRSRHAEPPLPCVVQVQGYGGGRGLPLEHALYPAVGIASFVMDSRAQGSTQLGSTGDPGAGAGAFAETPGVMTRGILEPGTYYYVRLYLDVVRALETVRELPGVDAERIAISGRSQGGGLALAGAALAPELVRVCHADVPFLCDFGRALELASDPPYTEIVEFLRMHVDRTHAVRTTLSYVDCVHHARRISARTLMSANLFDTCCPPSTVFAVYNNIAAEKHIVVYEYSAHSSPTTQSERRLADLVHAFLP